VNWLLPLTHPTHADYMRWDLVQASARGDLTLVTQLVNTIGRDVTDVMSHALWTACYRGKVAIVDWLVTHTSANVNYSSMRYLGTGTITSLAAACYEGRMTVVKRLLTNATSPYDVNMVTSNKCNTALHEVIWYRQWTPLQVLCDRGDTAAVVDVVYKCDVNIQDRDGCTAMHYACEIGHLDTVKVLLSVFAGTNITNDDRVTPTALCEYYDCPGLAHYIQHKHPMSVSGDDDVSSNATVSGQFDHNNTGTQVTLEDENGIIDDDINAGVTDQTNCSTSKTRTDYITNKSKYADTQHTTNKKSRNSAFKNCCNVM
jgi:hypothetical protein